MLLKQIQARDRSILRQPDATDSTSARRLLDQWMRKQAERRFRNKLGKPLKRLAIRLGHGVENGLSLERN